jgi:outer membrane protein TolC
MTRWLFAALGLLAAAPAVADSAPLSFSDYLDAVEANAPALEAALARAKGAAADGEAAGLRPAPMVTYDQWGVPLSSPASLDRAQMLMLGVRQSLPPFGTAGSAHRLAAAKVAKAGAGTDAVRLDLRTSAARTWVSWWQAEERAKIAHESLAHLSGAVTLARARLAANKLDAAELLRLSAEEVEGREAALMADADVESLRRAINLLTGREEEAPLAAPSALNPGALAPYGERPDVAMARLDATRAALEVEAVRIDASRPSWEVGLQYQLMPMQTDTHGYAAMVGVSLPAFDPARTPRLRAAKAEAVAMDALHRDTERTARLEQSRATVERTTAKQALDLATEQRLPTAERALTATLASFAAGGRGSLELIDSLRTHLRARQAVIDAHARLLFAHVALSSALGLPPTLETDR